jgi:23S rRNA pseudoU1915 N3-methylase RlmH
MVEPVDDEEREKARQRLNPEAIKNLSDYVEGERTRIQRQVKDALDATSSLSHPVIPIDQKAIEAQVERRELAKAADRAAAEHMPMIAEAIIGMAGETKRLTTLTKWLILIGVLTFDGVVATLIVTQVK